MKPLSLLLFVVLSALAVAVDYRQVYSQQPQEISLRNVLIYMELENHCGCIGCGCPAYSVSIAGDGTVTYEGKSEVQITGKHTYSIPAERVRELVEEFHRINFFSLEDKYLRKKLDDGQYEMIDHTVPTTVSITIDGKTKSVYDFYGAPESLKELERKIYDLSGLAPYAAPNPSLGRTRN